MASTSFVPNLVNMVEIRAHGLGILLLLPVDEFGLLAISFFRLSIRFKLLASSIWIERELLNPVTLQISHTIIELSTHSEDGSTFWNLHFGQYCVYGVANSETPLSADVLPSSRLFTHTFSTPPVVPIKVEPRLDPVINSSNSSNDDRCVLPKVDPSPEAPFASLVPLPAHFQIPTSALPKSSVRKPCSIVDLLRKLANMPGRKNVLKKLDYNSLQTVHAEFLPPRFDGDFMYVLPLVSNSALHSKARSMDGMDKRYDGHVWIKTLTTNISNNLNLIFRSSICVGHLQCQNPECDYLKRSCRMLALNDMGFDGFSKEPFAVSGPPLSGSTLVCKICKEPPKCAALCNAKIFYIHGDDSSQRAYIHLGHHSHPIKVGAYRHSRKKIDAVIEEHVDRTSQATVSKIVIETSKDLLGQYLIFNEDDLPTVLSLNELEPVFDSCKELNSPSLQNRIYTFKYLYRFGIMDGITKLRGLSNWAYIQRNMNFPNQGDDSKKVFIFKMSEIGSGSGVDLVRRMQPGKDLKHAWIMFDHVKRVTNWTTMACHVYDVTYQCVMTIACYDFQSKDKDVQIIFWKNVNHVIARHGVLLPQFQGFMADSAQANWNAIQIVYGSGDPKVPMLGQEHICYFHWIQSLEKHIKQYIKHNLQDQYKHLCLQYRNAISMDEVETRYFAIKAWWTLFGAISENGLRHLELWLAF